MSRFKHLLLTLAFLAGAVAAWADETEFTADAPAIVRTGEPFRVEFSLNAKPDKDTFTAPDFAGFNVLAGPSVSHFTSMEIVNGSMSKSFTYRYTYVLIAPDKGIHTVGAATVKVKDRDYTTRPLKIEAVEEEGQGEAAAADNRPEQQAEQRIGKDDLLLQMHLSRTKVYKGEAVRATVKLYRRNVNIGGFDGSSFPSFNGFWAQEITPDNVYWQREVVAGRVYESLLVREYLLYPQQTGRIEIEPAELKVVARVVVQSNQIIDPFFGPQQEVYNVTRELKTSRLALEVQDLPEGAPESFTGAVGNFAISETTPDPTLTANSAATYTLRISGSGNLSFVQAPKLALPASFEQYTVKTTESIQTSQQGISGYRQFEYPFIARAEGDYTIDGVQFTYFDPSNGRYITLRGKPMTVTVLPDANGSGGETRVVKGLSKENVRLLGEDIRFIKIGAAGLHRLRAPFLYSGGYFLTVGLIALLFAAAYFLLRKRIRDNRNAVLVRGRRANKVAVQRLKTARGYMAGENRRAFYEEMLRALWGYMGDKLNIPVAGLTKERVREELQKRGLTASEAERFPAIITRCDEAQYSPSGTVSMNEVYAEAVDLLSHIESVIKR